LRAVQERVLAGDATARDLQPAVERHRAAAESLTKAAEGLLSGKGKSPSGATLERVRETFQAVPTDPELAELVEAGTLDRERRAAGLGLLAAPGPAGGGRKAPKKAKAAAKPKGGAGKAKAAAARESVRAARDRAKEARAAEREARKRLQRAERAAEDAVRDVERAEAALDDARSAAAGARDRLATAQTEHQSAEAAATDADEALERARGR
jgi:hypothetical protein